MASMQHRLIASARLHLTVDSVRRQPGSGGCSGTVDDDRASGPPKSGAGGNQRGRGAAGMPRSASARSFSVADRYRPFSSPGVSLKAAR